MGIFPFSILSFGYDAFPVCLAVARLFKRNADRLQVFVLCIWEVHKSEEQVCFSINSVPSTGPKEAWAVTYFSGRKW